MMIPIFDRPEYKRVHDEITEGVDPAIAATTLEVKCLDCGVSTHVTRHGGTLDCTCESALDSHRHEVFNILAGERYRIGTLGEIGGVPKQAKTNEGSRDR